MSNLINLALVGASGVVGKKIISLLENKNIEINNFYPLGSSSVGDEIVFNNNHVLDKICIIIKDNFISC